MSIYGHFIGLFKGFRNVCGQLWTLLRLSHGENRGFEPLGDPFGRYLLRGCLSRSHLQP